MPDSQSFPLGAACTPEGVELVVWAPKSHAVEVQVEGRGTSFALQPCESGYFRGRSRELRAGDRYRLWLDGEGPYPDPCSRYQPHGPHEPSQVVDAGAHDWTDAGWTGVGLEDAVIYELHIGAFTPEGTFDAAADKLGQLKAVGVTVIEIMPVGECPGRWNWGYDAVQWFAPSHCYGDYDAFKRFVDRAHGLGMAVILDVVYNHLGPDGNYLVRFSPFYLTGRNATEWGPTLNFDGDESHGTRELVLQNACYWIREFHLDGLRLDATQNIHDSSRPHILAQLVERVRAAAPHRRLLIIAENEPQHAAGLLPLSAGGFGLDAMWNDDFHHAARVALTGKREAYFHDYCGRPQEFVSAVKRGFLFQGQYYHWQRQGRGQRLRTARNSCVHFLQNHDQVANCPGGRPNLVAGAGRYRALTGLLLLGPQVPLLFMGQEFGATTPFHFFAEHAQGLRDRVYAGRREFLSQFPGVASDAGESLVPDPAAEQSFLRSKLDWREAVEHRHVLRLHTDLLGLRRGDAVLRRQDSIEFDGAILSDCAFVIRWFDTDHGDRLLVVNLGTEIDLHPAPEPLLAPVDARTPWVVLWSSEDIAYGGGGMVNPLREAGWRLPGQAAVLFKAVGISR